MKLKKLLFSNKQTKEIGKSQIYYLTFGKGFNPFFLGFTKNESIDILREFFKPDYSEEKKKEFKEIWGIIHKNYMIQEKGTKLTYEKKKSYYEKMRKERIKQKIKKLKEELKILSNLEDLRKWIKKKYVKD